MGMAERSCVDVSDGTGASCTGMTRISGSNAAARRDNVGSGTRRAPRVSGMPARSSGRPATQARPTACCSTERSAAASVACRIDAITAMTAPASRCWRANVLRACPGPTSMSARPGVPSSADRPSLNRTVCRRWRTQYSGDRAVGVGEPGAGHVRDDRDGRRRKRDGGETLAELDRGSARPSASAPPPRCAAGGIRRRRPRAQRQTPPVPAGSPDTTHEPSALTAAMARSRGMRARTSASGSGTASMPPGASDLEQAPAQQHEAQRVVERHDAGQAGGGVLAHAVADERVGPHAPRHPLPGERVLDREQRRQPPRRRFELRRRRRGRPAARLASMQRRRDRAPAPRQLRHRSTLVRETPARARSSPCPMADVLRAAAGEHEHRPTAAVALPWAVARSRGLPARRCADGLGGVMRHDERARRANGWRPARSVWATSRMGGVGVGVEGVGQARRRGVERGRRPRRQHQQRARGVGPLVRRGRGASSSTTWALVPPMPNELTPARRGVAPGGHGARRCVDEERRGREVDARDSASRSAGSGGISRCSQRQHRLDQAGDAGRGVEVADVGLHRAERAEAAGARCRRGTPGSARRPRSDRPAACRCRAPRRSRSCRGVDAGHGDGAARSPRPGPRRSARCSRPCRAVVVDRGAADHARGSRRRRRARRPAA